MSDYQAFEMPADNTCTDCGTPIKKGEAVYAKNFDEVRTGKGRCARCAGVTVEPEHLTTGPEAMTPPTKETEKTPQLGSEDFRPFVDNPATDGDTPGTRKRK